MRFGFSGDDMLMQLEQARIVFGQLDVTSAKPTFRINLNDLQQKSSKDFRALRYLRSSEIREELRTGKIEPKRANIMRFEVHQRSAIASIYFVYLFLGLPLGLMLGRGKLEPRAGGGHRALLLRAGDAPGPGAGDQAHPRAAPLRLGRQRPGLRRRRLPDVEGLAPMSRGLKLGGHLDRYVGSLYIASYATAFLVMIGLFLILDMASNLDDYLRTWKNGGSAPGGLVARYYLLNIPFVFLQVGPFVTLVAGLYTGSRLLRHMRSRLRSAPASHAPPAGAGVPGLDPVRRRDVRPARAGGHAARPPARRGQVHPRAREVRRGLFRALAARPERERRAPGRVPARGRQPAGTRGAQPGSDTALPERLSSTAAANARYEERHGVRGWWLQNAWHREVVGVDKQRPVERLEGFEFTPALVLAANRARENPMELSYREARELSRRDPDDLRYRMLMQYDFSFPLSNVVLLCIGLPYLMRRARGKPIEGVIAGSVLCIFYFATDFVMKNLGLQGELDPYLAAWLPIVVFGSLGLASYVTMDS